MNNTLNLSLTLRAIDQATAPIRRIQGALKSLTAPNLAGLRQSPITRLSDDAIKALAPIRSVARETSALALKLTALAGASGFAFKKIFIDVTAEFENLSVALETTEGSADKGKKAMAWIEEFAKKTPLGVNAATKSYMLLKNSGIDPMNGSLMALADSNAKVSGSQDDMIEKTRQLGQAWMKGKLQQEEIDVLTERGVAVVPLLAKALDKTDRAVMELVGNGKIGRKEIALLFEAMGKDAAGASEKQSRTWTGMISTLSDTWNGFVRDVMTKGGAFDFLKERLGKLIDTLKYLTTPEGMKETQAYAEQLRQTLEAIERGVKAAWSGLKQLKDMVGSWGNLAKGVMAAVAAIMAGPLLLAITNLVAGVGLLTAAFVANPILLTIMAVIGAIALVVRNWDTLVAKFKSGTENIMAMFKRWRGYLIDGIGAGITGLIDGILGIGRAISNLAHLKNPFAGGEAMFPMPPASQSVSQAHPDSKPQTRSPLNAVNNLLNFKAQVPRMPLLSIEAQPAPVKLKSILDFKVPSIVPAKATAYRPANDQPKGKTILDFKAPSLGPVRAVPAQAANDKPKARQILDYQVPTLSAQGKPVPTLSTVNKFDAGGTINFKFDQEGRVKVANAKTNDRRMNYNVDAGLIMPGAR